MTGCVIFYLFCYSKYYFFQLKLHSAFGLRFRLLVGLFYGEVTNLLQTCLPFMMRTCYVLAMGKLVLILILALIQCVCCIHLRLIMRILLITAAFFHSDSCAVICMTP